MNNYCERNTNPLSNFLFRSMVSGTITNLVFLSIEIDRIVHRAPNVELRVGQKSRMAGQPKRFTHDPEDDLTIFCYNDAANVAACIVH